MHALPDGLYFQLMHVYQGVFRRIYELLLEDGVISRHQVGVIVQHRSMHAFHFMIRMALLIRHPWTGSQVHRPDSLPDDETLQLVIRVFGLLRTYWPPFAYPLASGMAVSESCGRFTAQSSSGLSAAGPWMRLECGALGLERSHAPQL